MPKKSDETDVEATEKPVELAVKQKPSIDTTKRYVLKKDCRIATTSGVVFRKAEEIISDPHVIHLLFNANAVLVPVS